MTDISNSTLYGVVVVIAFVLVVLDVVVETLAPAAVFCAAVDGLGVEVVTPRRIVVALGVLVVADEVVETAKFDYANLK